MVIDASALLAFLQNEPGSAVVQKALEQPLSISAVSWTETVGKLVGAGVPMNQAETDLAQLGLEVVPFEASQMALAAWFYARRKPYSLSLGDCAVLALAEAKNLPVMTGEQHWAKLPNLRVEVKLIRKV